MGKIGTLSYINPDPTPDPAIEIYVISLVRAVERRIAIENTTNSFNQKYKFFDAIDGINKELIHQMRNNYTAYNVRDTQFACAISHVILLQIFLHSNNKYIIILEDDIELLRKLPTNDYEIEELFKDINIHDQDEYPELLYLHERVDSDYKYRVFSGHGTEAYIVSRNGAIKILDLLNPINGPIDIQINYSGKIKAYRSKFIYCKCNAPFSYIGY